MAINYTYGLHLQTGVVDGGYGLRHGFIAACSLAGIMVKSK